MGFFLEVMGVPEILACLQVLLISILLAKHRRMMRCRSHGKASVLHNTPEGGLQKRSLEPWTGLSGRPREDLTVAGENRSGPARARAMAQPMGRRKEREKSLGNTAAAMSLEKVDILKETTQNLPCLEWKIGDHIERA